MIGLAIDEQAPHVQRRILRRTSLYFHLYIRTGKGHELGSVIRTYIVYLPHIVHLPHHFLRNYLGYILEQSSFILHCENESPFGRDRNLVSSIHDLSFYNNAWKT